MRDSNPSSAKPRPRGRPRLAPDAQASRKALLRAGPAPLTERGYVAVRLAAVAATAGLAKGGFYTPFFSSADYGTHPQSALASAFPSPHARLLGAALNPKE